MNFETIMSYVCIGLVIACIFYIFKIVDCLIFAAIQMVRSLIYRSKPKPNRKRRFKNVDEIFILTKAANEFGFVLYDKTNPMKMIELKNRFRNKIKTAHPDVGGNVDEFIRIKQAYDVLLSHVVF